MDNAIEPKNYTPIGNRGYNDNAKKFRTSEDRRKVCQSYCDHISAGYSSESYHTYCTWKTIKHYRKLYPEDFPEEEIEKAEAKRLSLLETMGMQGAIGKLKGFNAHAWIFIMKNKANWKDRTDVTTNDEKIQGPSVYIPMEVEDGEVST